MADNSKIAPTDDPVDVLIRAADHLEKLLAEVSPGPWFYNSYNAIFSGPKVRPYDEWNPDAGHTLERYGLCAECGEWRESPYVRSPGLGHGCRLFAEDYKRDSFVASVPAYAGDTATGHRKRDAQWIATFDPLVGAHLVTILRGTADLSRRTGLIGEPLLRLAYAVLDQPYDPASDLHAEA